MRLVSLVTGLAVLGFGNAETMRAKRQDNEKGYEQSGMSKVQQKTIIMWNFMGPHLWHRVDVETVTLFKKQGTEEVVKQMKHVEKLKAYTWGAGGRREGEGGGLVADV